MGLIVLLLIAFILYALIAPIVASSKATDALLQVDKLNARILQLERRLAEGFTPHPEPPAMETAMPMPAAPVPLPAPRLVPPVPPPLPRQSPAPPVPVPAAVPLSPPPAAPVPAVSGKPQPARPAFTLEQFMGMKLFAWIGGLALFIGIVLFVKYAFEHNLIPPAGRVAIGFATGLALAGAGVWLRKREAYHVLSHTLCATGILTLYGVSFAGHALYDLYGTVPVFALMCGVTAAAFFCAVRMNAIVVAALGILGGFLTPVLVSTGRDQPLALFTYIGLLDAGVLLCVHRRGWKWLAAGAALGTAIMQCGWLARFFEESAYALRPAIPAAVLIVFPLLFLAAGWKRKNLEALASAAALAVIALLICFGALGVPEYSSRPGMLFGFVFAIQLLTSAAVWREARLLPASVLSGGLVFLLLSAWSVRCMTAESMPWALGLYVVFGLLQTVQPILMHRRMAAEQPDGISQWLPLSALALMTIAIVREPGAAAWMWPGMVAVNAGVFFLSALVRRPAPAIAASAGTLLALCAWLAALTADHQFRHSQGSAFLLTLTSFSVLLAAGGAWVKQRTSPTPEPDPTAMLLLVPSLLPFVLLIAAILTLPGLHIWAVAGVSLLLSLIALGTSVTVRSGWLCAAAAAALLLVQSVWRNTVTPADHTALVLTWHAAGWAIFLICPFLFRRRFETEPAAWAASALIGTGQALYLYLAVRTAWPALPPGLIPAACSLPVLGTLALAVRRPLENASVQRTRLALYGGVALLFLTAIIPVQWRMQWITLGFALEGAALCWLRRRVDHDGLRITGIALLTAAFLRLTLNAAAYTYYPRTALPILNWQLYTYGTAIAACIAALRFLRPLPCLPGAKALRAMLGAMAGVLGFLLLNIEIADFFTADGSPYIQWQFRGDFAASMTFTIAWALYALGLVTGGFAVRSRAVRITGIALMALALLKLFLHDLSEIGSLYRIAALLIVAIIALVMSWLYQRFAARLAAEETRAE